MIECCCRIEFFDIFTRNSEMYDSADCAEVSATTSMHDHTKAISAFSLLFLYNITWHWMVFLAHGWRCSWTPDSKF